MTPQCFLRAHLNICTLRIELNKKGSINNALAMFALFFTCKPFPKQQILNSSQFKEFADGNFKFDGNGVKLNRMVENIV